MAQGPVGVPPVFAVAIYGARAADAYVFLLVDIHERGGPGHFDSGYAGGHHRVLVCVLNTADDHTVSDFKMHVRPQKDGTGDVCAGAKGDGASAGLGSRINGRLNGVRVKSDAV